MSFIRLFDGDFDVTTVFHSSDVQSNINDEFLSATPLKIHGFDGIASEANGNYSLTGDICNCFPSLVKNVSTSNATLSNSVDFFNSDSFYYFKSPAVNSNTSFDSLYAHPDFFKIENDSSKFSGQSHYINFLLDTDSGDSDSTSYFGFLFDDENNAGTKKYLNHNLSSATFNLSYSFISQNQRSFETGLLFKQSNNFFVLNFGSTGSDSTATPITLSKSYNDFNFTLIYGELGASFDTSGQTPFEVGVYFKDSSGGDRRGLATNFVLQINNIAPKKYYLFNHNDKAVISDVNCSVSNDANYIYSDQPINAHCHYFYPNNGSTALFTNQKGYAVNYGLESQAVSSKTLNSDSDSLIDSLDFNDPYGMQNASYSLLNESSFTTASIEYNERLDIILEGFKYTYDGSDSRILLDNNILNITTMFEYISNIINLESSNTGIRALKDPNSNDLIFWRPKGGSSVSGYASVYLNSGTVNLPINTTTDNYYIAPTPTETP